MSQLSLGIIETLGLATAINVADICVKSANVNLIGYEFSKGGGMTTIKIEGNIGAVNAAVDAALASTDKIAFSKVIARPSKEIEGLIRNSETVGFEIEEAEQDPQEQQEQQEVKEAEVKQEQKEEILKKTSDITSKEKVKDKEVEESIELEDVKKKYTCNICKDPKCTRKKGELTSTCIHHKKR